MVFPSETIGHLTDTELEEKCDICGTLFKLKVCHSNAGYYVGTACCEGPNSRESGYYKTHKEAEDALNTGYFGR